MKSAKAETYHSSFSSYVESIAKKCRTANPPEFSHSAYMRAIYLDKTKRGHHMQSHNRTQSSKCLSIILFNASSSILDPFHLSRYDPERRQKKKRFRITKSTTRKGAKNEKQPHKNAPIHASIPKIVRSD